MFSSWTGKGSAFLGHSIPEQQLDNGSLVIPLLSALWFHCRLIPEGSLAQVLGLSPLLLWELLDLCHNCSLLRSFYSQYLFPDSFLHLPQSHPSLAMPLSLAASMQSQAGNATVCMGLCCVFHTALRIGTHSLVSWELTWLLSSRWTSPDCTSSSVLAPNWADLWADDNHPMSEMFSPHLSPLWQKLVQKITHSLGHRIVCWGMN